MKIVFTIHTKEKFKSNEAKILGISKQRIKETLEKPIKVDKTLNPHRSLGNLNETLSLAVIWKKEGDIIKVITFYPAEKGRYESKVSRRR